MDLIPQLPPCKTTGHDCIVTFVDRLTKMIHVVPTTTNVNAEQLAHLFYETVFRHHGMPKVVVSDRDPRFTSIFWQELFRLTGTRLAMSSAYHPQTDGQTERANRTIEDMLRAYVSPHHDDWDKHLTAVEFAYNNSVQASTGFSPFYLNSGDHPHTPLAMQSHEHNHTPVPSTEAYVTRMAKDLELARENIKEAQERQARYADQKRKPYTFKPGDQVLLSYKFTDCLPPALAIAGTSVKLRPRGWGPFKVEQVINDVACRLILPKTWKIHPVIHSSYLTPWRDGSNQFPDREPPPPDPEIVDDEEHYHVEAFLNHRFSRHTLQYLVKWTGYSDEHNEWISIHQLTADLSPDALEKLVEAYRQRRELDKDFQNKPVTVKRTRRRQ